MAKIFLHVASHRTGTTHFQSTLLRNAKRLRKFRCTFRKLQRISGFRLAAIRMRVAAETAGRDVPRTERRFHRAMLAVAKVHSRILTRNRRQKHILLSYEGHLGSMSFGRAKQLYAGHAQISKSIAKMYAGEEIVIGLSIRSYDDLIESTYKRMVHIGYSVPFSQYSADIDYEHLSWLPIVKELQRTFGSDHVLVWSYEAYSGNLREFYTWLFDMLGINADAAKKLKIDSSRRNKSPTKLSLRAELVTNKIIGKLVRKELKKRIAIKLNKHIERMLGREGSKKPILLDQETKRVLRQRYRDDIERIRELAPVTSHLSIAGQLGGSDKSLPQGVRPLG